MDNSADDNWLNAQVSMPKMQQAFTFGRWNTGTNPDLAFASLGPYSRIHDRNVFEKFSRLPKVITFLKLKDLEKLGCYCVLIKIFSQILLTIFK